LRGRHAGSGGDVQLDPVGCVEREIPRPAAAPPPAKAEGLPENAGLRDDAKGIES